MAIDPGRRSSLPVFSAAGISVYSVDHLAPDLQPWKQNPSCQHEERPSRGRLLIAMRPVWTVLYPARVAPLYMTLKLLFPGRPGISLVRVTPILYSALAKYGPDSRSVRGRARQVPPLFP